MHGQEHGAGDEGGALGNRHVSEGAQVAGQVCQHLLCTAPGQADRAELQPLQQLPCLQAARVGAVQVQDIQQCPTYAAPSALQGGQGGEGGVGRTAPQVRGSLGSGRAVHAAQQSILHGRGQVCAAHAADWQGPLLHSLHCCLPHTGAAVSQQDATHTSHGRQDHC